MDCIKIDRMLDDYIDGVLAPDACAALEKHCMECATCAAKLRSADQLRMILSELPEEPDIPLKTQAAWRSAVKAEAGRQKRRRIWRMAGGIAAALVVAAGATFAIRDRVPARYGGGAVPMLAEKSVAMIEADGRTAGSVDAGVDPAMPMHEYVMTVEDLGKTCDYVSDLVDEYEGSVDVQRFEQGGCEQANLYVEMPSENAADFMRAVGHFDTADGGSEAFSITPGDDGRTSILLVLKEE